MSTQIALMGAMLGVLGGMIALFQALSARQKRASHRLDLLRQALDRPDLDADTRKQILSVLTREHDGFQRPLLMRGEFWRCMSFGSGWLLFILFGGLVALHMLNLVWTPAEYVVPMALIGLALLTLPIGLREFGRQGDRLAEPR